MKKLESSHYCNITTTGSNINSTGANVSMNVSLAVCKTVSMAIHLNTFNTVNKPNYTSMHIKYNYHTIPCSQFQLGAY